MNKQLAKCVKAVIIWIISLLILLVITLTLISEAVTYSNYTQVVSEIVELAANGHPDSDGDMNYDYTITVRYTVDGEEYTELALITASEHRKYKGKEGEQYIVRVNPNKHNELANEMQLHSLKIFIIVLGVWSLLLTIYTVKQLLLVNRPAKENVYLH